MGEGAVKSTDPPTDLEGRHFASATDDGRYRLLIEAVTDYAIYMLDAQGIVSSWNPGAQRFKGYAASEIVGQHFSRFYSEEDRNSGLPARALETARREGKFESEGWRVRKDGTRFWAYVVIDPIRAPSGAVVGYAKITRDLTERKKAEAVLKSSEEQFRLLVQGVTDYAIYMLDPTGVVTSWNAGAQRFKGYSAEEIIGEHFSRFYTEEDRARGLRSPCRQILQSAGFSFHGPCHPLSRGHGRRAQAQRSFLHSRRGLSDGRNQAWPERDD